ncbi:MAG: penicillin-binding protein 2 [Phycisphaeraceae bacterium]|nr:penicillin-binding protein 2 [Phycisphaeraceae bacterium]
MSDAPRPFRPALAWTLLIVVGLILVANVVRVAQLKVAPHPDLLQAAGHRESHVREIALRGEILDRRGRVLAVSVVGHRLFADPAMIWERGWERVRRGRLADPDSPIEADPFRDASLAIGHAVGIDPDKLLERFRTNADRRYMVVVEHLSDWQLDSIQSLRMQGVGIEPRLTREYPAGALAARVVGVVGFDQSGQSGIELTRNRRMAPQDGAMTYLRDARRRPLWIERDGYRPGEAGDTVRLTIDSVIQEIAERHLEASVNRFNAAGGRIVVVDVESGDILAMADVMRQRPGFREVAPPDARDLHPALGRNRCLSDPYEPGSTFKPFVWAWATKLGIFKPESIVNLPAGGPYQTSFGRLIRDVKYYGPNTWRFVLVKSLNAGMAIAAERMKFADMQACVRAFGFGQRTQVGLAGETAGIITPPKQWKAYTQTSVCMGHEISVTPVQMARAFLAFCRDGTLPPLRLELPSDDAAALTLSSTPVEGVRVLPEAIAQLTREVMAEVMADGTGRRAQSSLYRIFGKTGTAQLPRPDRRGYYDDRYVSNFVGGAPLERPRIAVVAVIDDPDKRKGHFGGETAAPLARDVIDETLQYLGVAPDQDAKRASAIRRTAAANAQ